MRIDLSASPSRFLFFVAILLLAGTLAFFAGKVWLAGHLDSSSSPQLWQKATRWEPGNARYWEHLGLYEQWDVMNGHANQPASYLERATAINPQSDRLWLELANAYEIADDQVRARQAYEKAEAARPNSPEVASRYGSFLLRQGELLSGFAEIRRALATDPSLTLSAISECWKTNPNIEAILSRALPAKSGYYVTAIQFFLGEKQFDAAIAVWKRLLILGQPITMAQAIPLVNALIDQNRVAEAEQSWQEALELTNWPKGHHGGESLVFNGGFENEPAQGGFDWRDQSVPGVSYTLDTAVLHSGKQSMRVAFDGRGNFDFTNLLQYVRVQPGQTYHFSAYLRTEAITTDSGMRFSIYDPFHPARVQVLTSQLTGTNPWMPLSTQVTAAADTNFLVIALRRIPSWKFDNKLRGTVWVDDVALTPLGDPRKGGWR